MNGSGCGQAVGICAPLVGLPALCPEAAGKGPSATTVKAAYMYTHCCLAYPQNMCAFSTEAHMFLRVWLLNHRYHFLSTRAPCP